MTETTRRNGGRSASYRLGNAFHYRERRSPLHRWGAGTKLLLAATAGAAAVAARSPWAQAGLLLALLAGYRGARLSVRELWQDVRWLGLQTAVVVALHVARDGAAGAAPGLRVGLQILLFFLPGALLLRTTPSRPLLESLERILPRRLGFALSTSFRFVPYFARELEAIVLAQRLRGARLALRDAWRPSAWGDWLHCVALPLVVRALKAADEASLAAAARGLPRTPREDRIA